MTSSLLPRHIARVAVVGDVSPGFRDAFDDGSASITWIAGGADAFAEGFWDHARACVPATVDAFVNATARWPSRADIGVADEFDQGFDSTVKRLHLGSAAFASIISDGGCIINLIPVTAEGDVLGAALGGSAVTLTRALAWELAPRIRVECVLGDALDGGAEPAGVARFLTSREASFLTGLTLEAAGSEVRPSADIRRHAV
ncbi:MAG: hypothetical protein ABWY50_07035 [Aeromicrobium sp.]